MENLPILNFKDLYQLWRYSDRHHFYNGVAPDDPSLEVMLRIEKTMQHLKVMGNDDRRTLWIRLKSPARYRYGIVDEQKLYWCQLSTAKYEGRHYLILDNPDGWGNRLVLMSCHNASRLRDVPDYKVDVMDGLLLLEGYVNALVASICENPDVYNDYIEENLPYGLRSGRIKRADLNRTALQKFYV